MQKAGADVELQKSNVILLEKNPDLGERYVMLLNKKQKLAATADAEQIGGMSVCGSSSTACSHEVLAPSAVVP
ncbi:hypothetical protein [Reyranella sp.]|uniref:hypothetical protein n=1 Tax=Reyranella sp. TaxID=1929291 RepID=UPI003D09FE14